MQSVSNLRREIPLRKDHRLRAAIHRRAQAARGRSAADRGADILPRRREPGHRAPRAVRAVLAGGGAPRTGARHFRRAPARQGGDHQDRRPAQRPASGCALEIADPSLGLQCARLHRRGGQALEPLGRRLRVGNLAAAPPQQAAGDLGTVGDSEDSRADSGRAHRAATSARCTICSTRCSGSRRRARNRPWCRGPRWRASTNCSI